MKRRGIAVILLLCFLLSVWTPTALAAGESAAFLAIFDIDGDGAIRTADARTVLRAAVGLTELKMTELEINACGTDFVKLTELTARQQELTQRISDLTDRWAYLEELAEAEAAK